MATIVAEAFLSASVEVLLDKIISPEFMNFFRNRKLDVSLLEKMKTTLLSLQAVLNDAEEKQITNPAVKEWLDKLRDAVFEADELMDEINTEALRCKVKTKYQVQTASAKVRNILSSTFKQSYGGTNSKMQTLFERLEHFAQKGNLLGLKEGVSSSSVWHGNPTSSIVDESAIYGRDGDRKKLKDYLLSEDTSDSGYKIGVITIVGMGGLGKTTLAKLLYNDPDVKEKFNLKAWAHISKDFDVSRVTKTLLESVTSRKAGIDNLNSLQVQLQQSLAHKRFLIVLDDIWDVNYVDWNNKGHFCRWGYWKLDEQKSHESLERVRHLSYNRGRYDSYNKFDKLYQLKGLHTFLPLPLQEPWIKHLRSYLYLSNKIVHELLPALKQLQVLSLSHYYNITELPNSIGDLIYLRYLNLSFTMIKKLPSATCKLYNLQTLLLTGCEDLTELPEDMGKLVNLRHLDISETGFELKELPIQIAGLQNLQTLSKFIVSEQHDGPKVAHLGKFLYLQGKLSISGLERVVDSSDAFHANLKMKEGIDELELQWGWCGRNTQGLEIERLVLEQLHPSTNLKNLTISGYCGSNFPNWLVNIKTVGAEFYGNGSPSFQSFPSLEILEFERMDRWEEWKLIGGTATEFPNLRHLSLTDCPKLKGNIPTNLPSFTELVLKKCGCLLESGHSDDNNNNSTTNIIRSSSLFHFHQSMLPLNSLRKLRIEVTCHELESFSPVGLPTPNLVHFTVGGCDKLPSLPEPMNAFPGLQEMEISDLPNLQSFAKEGLPINLRQLNVGSLRRNLLNTATITEWNLERLTCLSELLIHGDDIVNALMTMEVPVLPASIVSLSISSLDDIECLDGKWLHHLTSLQTLQISHCRNLKSLPEEGLPSSLSALYIYQSPLLEASCQRKRGKDWAKIARIPWIDIDCKLITRVSSLWNWHPQKIAAENDKNLAEILEDLNSIDVAKCMNFVIAPQAGAIATFSGTTHDTFEGNTILELRYEAYVPMAIRCAKSEVYSNGEVWKENNELQKRKSKLDNKVAACCGRRAKFKEHNKKVCYGTKVQVDDEGG
ncbi:P-loop containing nucleoside triphosphate hydrolase [Sesbania bispinosa]|nr:P-loop containing nucleoside triphosphate hydrolase [Sesbania bispinosa]